MLMQCFAAPGWITRNYQMCPSASVLIDCNLQHANLYGADLRDALLVKVDLRGANLTATKLEGARFIDVAFDRSELDDTQRAALATGGL